MVYGFQPLFSGHPEARDSIISLYPHNLATNACHSVKVMNVCI